MQVYSSAALHMTVQKTILLINLRWVTLKHESTPKATEAPSNTPSQLLLHAYAARWSKGQTAVVVLMQNFFCTALCEFKLSR
eukprot:6120542-Pleurochrysis_carterae.AAC.1